MQLIMADNQPIAARWGEDAIWITDLITPKNPSVQLAYRELTKGITSQEARINALWYYVSHMPYKEAIATSFSAGGKTFKQKDTWLFPAETMIVRVSNCANRSFLLASLLKNEFEALGQVYCSIGQITLDGIGNHAWISLDIPGGPYIIETTQPNLDRAVISMNKATAYSPYLHFDESYVWTSIPNLNPRDFLENRFGVCAVPFLKDYLCQHCLEL